MSGLTVGTQTIARDALGILDKAIDRVNSIRGNLGATRNRLNYTLDNLLQSPTRPKLQEAAYSMQTSPKRQAS